MQTLTTLSARLFLPLAAELPASVPDAARITRQQYLLRGGAGVGIVVILCVLLSVLSRPRGRTGRKNRR